MVIFLACLYGLIVWIVLWAIGVKSFDAFMITILFALGGVVIHVIKPYLPGNRREELPPPGA